MITKKDVVDGLRKAICGEDAPEQSTVIDCPHGGVTVECRIRDSSSRRLFFDLIVAPLGAISDDQFVPLQYIEAVKQKVDEYFPAGSNAGIDGIRQQTHRVLRGHLPSAPVENERSSDAA